MGYLAFGVLTKLFMYKHLVWGVLIVVFVSTACVRTQPIVVETAVGFPTSAGQISVTLATPTLLVLPSSLSTTIPTPDTIIDIPLEYIVQDGDTLTGIAVANGISLQSLLDANSLANPDVLSVGQIIYLPKTPDRLAPTDVAFPDSLVIPSDLFDVGTFVASQNGYIRKAFDIVDSEMLTAEMVVQRVSQEYSVDARLLLALLEFRSGWLTSESIDDNKLQYPILLAPSADGLDRRGLYRQLSWAANQINAGYYGWKYRNLRVIELIDSVRFRVGDSSNAGTVAVQFVLSKLLSESEWLDSVSEAGLYQVYVSFFGLPVTQPVSTQGDLTQPPLTLPFQSGERWYFTGGPHGGWGSGSAWASVDFAPPDDPAVVDSACYTSQFAARAVVSGTIARVSTGTVILDLDYDGNEFTGWNILYLHLDIADNIVSGMNVLTGDVLGYPSCEGGFSTATHLHIARRFNGEWIPADCSLCEGIPSFNMGGWTFYGIAGQEYQGYMQNGTERRNAEQGRETPVNWISW